MAASTSTKHLVPQALSHALQNTVDLTLESALTTIDMLFPARDDAPVTQASLVSGSWDPEPAPEPAAVDSWLRATIPETTVPKQSYMLTEFLRGSPSMRRSDSKRGGNPRTSVSGLPGGAAPPRSSTASPVAAAAGGSPNSRRSSPAVPSPPRTAAANASRKQQLTPEQAAAEARLREELEVRRAQQAVLAEQEAKDAEARARVQALGKELRGKEYSYDHRGKVVPLAPLPADGGLLSSAAAGQAAGPQFAVRTPTPTQGAGAGGAKGRKGGQRAGALSDPFSWVGAPSSQVPRAAKLATRAQPPHPPPPAHTHTRVQASTGAPAPARPPSPAAARPPPPRPRPCPARSRTTTSSRAASSTTTKSWRAAPAASGGWSTISRRRSRARSPTPCRCAPSTPPCAAAAGGTATPPPRVTAGGVLARTEHRLLTAARPAAAPLPTRRS